MVKVIKVSEATHKHFIGVQMHMQYSEGKRYNQDDAVEALLTFYMEKHSKSKRGISRTLENT